MSNETPQEGEDRALFAFLAGAFRADGKLFPLSDEEIDKFCAEYKPDEADRKLFARATERAFGAADRARKSRREPKHDRTNADRELGALHRNEGEMSDEIKKKLEDHRRRIKAKAPPPTEDQDAGETDDRSAEE